MEPNTNNEDSAADNDRVENPQGDSVPTPREEGNDPDNNGSTEGNDPDNNGSTEGNDPDNNGSTEGNDPDNNASYYSNGSIDSRPQSVRMRRPPKMKATEASIHDHIFVYILSHEPNLTNIDSVPDKCKLELTNKYEEVTEEMMAAAFEKVKTAINLIAESEISHLTNINDKTKEVQVARTELEKAKEQLESTKKTVNANMAEKEKAKGAAIAKVKEMEAILFTKKKELNEEVSAMLLGTNCDYDAVTGMRLPSTSGKGSSVSDWMSKVFDMVFTTQIDAIYKDDCSRMVAEEMKLKEHCMANKLIPILVDQVMPDDHFEFENAMTHATNQIYTTPALKSIADAQEHGWACVAPSGLTIDALKTRICDAKLLDKKVPTRAESEAYQKILGEVENKLITEATSEKAGADSAYLTLLEKVNVLQEKAKSAGARVRAVLNRQIKQHLQTLKLLNHVQKEKSEATADDAGKLSDAFDKIYTQTQKTFNALKMEENVTLVPNLPAAAVGVNYSFNDWQKQEAGLKSSFYIPQVSLSNTLKSEFDDKMADAVADYQSIVTEYENRITKKKTELNEATEAKEKKKIQNEIDQLETKRDMKQGNIDQIHERIAEQKIHRQEVMQRAREREEAAVQVKGAAANSKKAYETFLSDNGVIMVPRWAQTHSESGDGAFKKFRHSKTYASQSRSESQNSKSSSTSWGFEAAVSYGFFKADVGASSSSSESHAESQASTSTKSEKWCVSFEALYAGIQNECWDLIEQLLSNSGWYLEGVAPAAFWKMDGLAGRLVASEAVFIQKFAFFCSNSAAATQFAAETNSSASSFSSHAGASYGCFGSASGHYSNSKSKQDASEQQGMDLVCEENTVTQGNLVLKFLLLKPIIPAPLRGGLTEEQKIMTEAECFEEIAHQIPTSSLTALTSF